MQFNKYTHTHTHALIPPWEDQCEWHRRMTGPDCAVMCNLINTHAHTTPRTLSLRNLVSGYECGRVFPADVGPGSPSRDAVNWLLSRFGLSVETRRQYGWLRMVFSGVRFFRVQFGGLREGGGTREAGSTVAESLVALYQVGTHQIRRRRRAARSSTSQGRAEPLCARIESANREVSEGKADL